ncbi:MAG: hypothetical protein GXN92_03660 [Candidatus Micrarchaeota archaeon]|nr:hypothetical protein [Candidatus Micrarchaeota archaeon]
MLYRIPLDHCGIKKVIVKEKGLACPEHGDMNVVTVVDKDGKKVYWFRCVFCHIGAAYDLEGKGEIPEWVCDEEKIEEIKNNPELKEQYKDSPIAFLL